MSKKQNYENYWKITLEYSDIYGEKFNKTLKIIIDFIDENSSTEYSKEKYQKLQEKISRVFVKADDASTRKSINQFVKLGFIEPKLIGYHERAKSFVNETNKQKKKSIFSRIVYSNSSFDSAVTHKSDKKEINFLLKTLSKIKKIEKKDVLALMTVDISKFKKGYLTEDELEEEKRYTETINFISRKYNQLGHFWSILKNLDDLIVSDNYLCFEEDYSVIEEMNSEIVKARDSYLHRLYKNELKEETKETLGSIKCMLEKLDYPSLVASHIKPFIKSSEYEAYDVNNGLLLSRNMDILFDQGYISFGDDGQIILTNQLSNELKTHLKSYSLDNFFINETRKKYLDYHRSNVLRK